MISHSHTLLIIFTWALIFNICFRPTASEPIPRGVEWTAWSEWSRCSATCGPGSRIRYRQCVASREGLYMRLVSSRCTGYDKEEENCFAMQCPQRQEIEEDYLMKSDRDINAELYTDPDLDPDIEIARQDPEVDIIYHDTDQGNVDPGDDLEANDPGSYDIRTTGCAQHNDDVVYSSTYEWQPITNNVNPCELTCAARGLHFVHSFGHITDGASCTLAGNQTGVCQNGQCIALIGCDDNTINNCNGCEESVEGCSSERETDRVTSQVSNSGKESDDDYVIIGIIPKEASYVSIEKIGPCSLAISYFNESFIVNEALMMDMPRKYVTFNTTFTFEITSDDVASIRTDDILRESLYLQTIFQDPTVNIQWEYQPPHGDFEIQDSSMDHQSRLEHQEILNYLLRSDQTVARSGKIANAEVATPERVRYHFRANGNYPATLGRHIINGGNDNVEQGDIEIVDDASNVDDHVITTDCAQSSPQFSPCENAEIIEKSGSTNDFSTGDQAANTLWKRVARNRGMRRANRLRNPRRRLANQRHGAAQGWERVSPSWQQTEGAREGRNGRRSGNRAANQWGDNLLERPENSVNGRHNAPSNVYYGQDPEVQAQQRNDHYIDPQGLRTRNFNDPVESNGESYQDLYRSVATISDQGLGRSRRRKIEANHGQDLPISEHNFKPIVIVDIESLQNPAVAGERDNRHHRTFTEGGNQPLEARDNQHSNRFPVPKGHRQPLTERVIRHQRPISVGDNDNNQQQPFVAGNRRHHRPFVAGENRYQQPSVNEEGRRQKPSITGEIRHQQPLVATDNIHEGYHVAEDRRHQRPLAHEDTRHQRPLVAKENRHLGSFAAENRRNQGPFVTENSRPQQPLVVEDPRHKKPFISEDNWNQRPSIERGSQNRIFVTDEDSNNEYQQSSRNDKFPTERGYRHAEHSEPLTAGNDYYIWLPVADDKGTLWKKTNQKTPIVGGIQHHVISRAQESRHPAVEDIQYRRRSNEGNDRDVKETIKEESNLDLRMNLAAGGSANLQLPQPRIRVLIEKGSGEKRGHTKQAQQDRRRSDGFQNDEQLTGCRQPFNRNSDFISRRLYCDSDFVLRATINDYSLVEGESRYELVIEETYRTSSGAPLLSREHIWIPRGCVLTASMSIIKGGEYVVFGQFGKKDASKRGEVRLEVDEASSLVAVADRTTTDHLDALRRTTRCRT